MMPSHCFWIIAAVLFGACVGSFLNVVIYRMPLGISVSKPKRSFCPLCKKQLTALQNIPVLSWLFLRGKCGHCAAPIPFRYPLVELTTSILFGLIAWQFPLIVVPFLCVFAALLIAITFIDAEHMIIPTQLTWAGSAIGITACVVYAPLSDLSGFAFGWKQGLLNSVLGWVVGFIGLRAVVEFGKRVFGKVDMEFETPVSWQLKEPEGDDDQMLFIVDDQEIPWWDIFTRSSDQLILQATELTVDGKEEVAGEMAIKERAVILSDGRELKIEDIVSLSGKTNKVVVPREAMGMGDPHLLGMVGAFLGWSGALFAIFGATFIALAAALIARIGFGKPLPFGPFIAAGAIFWMLGGWKLWQRYLEFVGL